MVICMKPLTLEQTKNLKFSQIVYAIDEFNADNTHMRFRVNGQVKTWKRDSKRVSVPVKRGMYEYGYITEANFELFSLTE